MEIGIQSGIQLILQAITVHFDELSLIKNAYYSLATLTFGHPINCAFIMASQGIGPAPHDEGKPAAPRPPRLLPVCCATCATATTATSC
jgi:hypothetical protein